MRVVAGVARGRRLSAPTGRDTRPTADRVREAIFGALGSLGAVEGAAVLDLFAGSGAMGIEAVSRGAASATLVDHDREARSVIAANLAATGLAERAIVVAGDAFAHLARASEVYDLALLDPPYAFDRWSDLGAALLPRLAPGAVVVAESDREIDPGAGFVVVRVRRYGSTVVTMARAPEGPPPPAGAPA